MCRSSDLISRFQASGLTQKQFCTTESISVSTLQYHLKKSRSETIGLSAAPAFISLPREGESKVSTLVILKGRFSLPELSEFIGSLGSR
jgi:hypothetical protein